MIREFLSNSEELDIFVTKQLSHIVPNWELIWDEENDKYLEEEDSFAMLLNKLIGDLEETEILEDYHEKEDIVARYVNAFLNWDIVKNGKRWEGAEYRSILNQGGFHDDNQKNLKLCAVGRMRTAMHFGQFGFDNMENGHKKILGDILATILYHRWAD